MKMKQIDELLEFDFEPFEKVLCSFKFAPWEDSVKPEFLPVKVVGFEVGQGKIPAFSFSNGTVDRIPYKSFASNNNLVFRGLFDTKQEAESEYSLYVSHLVDNIQY